MKDAVLDRKIHRFMARKERQYPELTQPINQLTRELEADQVASPLHLYARDVNQHDAHLHIPNHGFPNITYAL